MYCLRCGAETEAEQVFCQKCTENMDRHPVKPGTPIKLPSRSGNAGARKQNRKKSISAEEQISRLRVRSRTFIVLWLCTLILLGVLGFLYIKEVKEPNAPIIPAAKASSDYTESELEF